MTIDERLEHLVERHEALTETVEILTRDIHEMQTAVSRLTDNMTRLDRRERKTRDAILNAVVAYLKSHNGEEA